PGEKGRPGDPVEVDDGVSIRTAMVFKRSSSQPDRPTGGSYENPVPDDSSWETSPVSGAESIWISTRIFASDGGDLQETQWSVPRESVSAFDIEFRWSSYIGTDPGTPTSNPQIWHNTESQDTVWMAFRYKVEGLWGVWTVLRIKGADGEAGKDGDQFEFRFS